MQTGPLFSLPSHHGYMMPARKETPLPLIKAVGVLGALSWCLSGCLLNTKKSNRGRSGDELILRDSIYLDRIADGVAGRLQFKTSRNAVCEIAFYSQEPNVVPTKEKPTVIPCTGAEKARQEFTERLEELSTSTLYFVVITAWEPTAGKKRTDSVTVREGAGSPAADGSTKDDGSLKELFVGRIDLPLKVAEFHRHTLVKPSSLTEIKRALSRAEGCQVTVPTTPAPYRDATTNLGILNLATRDLATGSAIPHRDDPQRQTMQFSSINSGMDKWSLFYQWNGRDVLIPARPIAAFASVIMTSTQPYNFESPQLTESADPFRIDATQALKFSWTSSSPLTTSSYVTVQIGRSNNPASIFCTFAAEKRAGSIEPQMLASLPPDKYVISIELVTNLVIARENWLVTAHDWRSGRLEK